MLPRNTRGESPILIGRQGRALPTRHARFPIESVQTIGVSNETGIQWRVHMRRTYGSVLTI